MFDSLNSLPKWTRANALLMSLLFIALWFTAGCGYAQYEARLAESKAYYAHLEKIEQSLAPKWNSASNVLDLRVPRQFTLIPPPQPIKKDDGELEMPAFDPRQPDYVTNLNFPELFGAWEAVFRVAKKDGTTEERKGYIYALSNYWELISEKSADAGKFTDSLKTMMADKLGVPAEDETSFVWPKTAPFYTPQVTFDKCLFKDKDIEGVNYTFEVYSRTNSSVIGVIVIALPEGMDSPQKVNERIPMMLGTFGVTSTPPKQGTDKNAAPTAGPGVQF